MDASGTAVMVIGILFGIAAIIYGISVLTMDRDRLGPSYFSSKVAGLVGGIGGSLGSLAGSIKGLGGSGTSGGTGISGDIVFPDWVLKYGPIVFFIILIAIFLSIYLKEQLQSRYRSTPQDIATVQTARRTTLADVIQLQPTPLRTLTGDYLRSGNQVSRQITTDKRALVNFRPLCVQNTGYLGGLNEENLYKDGVYDVDPQAGGLAIPLSIRLGARVFMLNIDYLDATPCAPILLYRDRAGYRRSLNTGSFSQAIKQIADNSFAGGNYDPVLVILYFNRIPVEPSQYDKFFKAVALGLAPLSQNHLGQTDRGVFTRCRMESQLFTSIPITDLQKKFIVLTNVNTFDFGLPKVKNPKESLHFYTNARIFADAAANNRSVLGSVTQLPPGNTVPAVVVGSFDDYRDKTSENLRNLRESTRGKFTIALRSPSLDMSTDDLQKILNVCQIQCVPLDVLNLAMTEAHKNVLSSPAVTLITLDTLSNQGEVSGDPLSYWRYAGWTPKVLRVDEAGATDFGYWFVIPTPTAPQAPSLTTNANGGLFNVT